MMSEKQDAARRRKRITPRQWFHRLIHRKCWNCNVPLEYVNDRYGRVCPCCQTFYSEMAMITHEKRIRAVWWLKPRKAVTYLAR